jgi:hypothetical protein
MPGAAAIMMPGSDVPWSRVTRQSIDILNVCERVLQPFLIDAADNGLDLRLLDGQIADAVAC